MRWPLPTLALVAAIVTFACGDDLRDGPVSVDEMWPEPPVEDQVDEAIEYADRAAGNAYGLPRAGESGIADLIALFPDEPPRRDDPDIFASPDLSFPGDQCRGGSPAVVTELPMTIEAVVTLYPRQYMKVTVCGQDERHYGTFTVEDDTGGIVVLRDSRVAPYTYGDRVRLTVHAVTLTFGPELDTRAILVADIDQIPGRDAILYSTTTEPFSAADAGLVRQIEGWVHGVPTSLNFNTMIVTERRVTAGAGSEQFTGAMLQCVRSCEVRCAEGCPSLEACADICPDACVAGGAEFDEASLPACWSVGISAELGRRGFAPAYGTHLRIRGPVVNSFDVQMWVLSPGQVEFLD